MNSINWPASSVWVFVAQLVEHCSVNAEAMGSNSVEAQKNFFQAISRLLKLRFTEMVTLFISFVFLQFTSCYSEYTSMFMQDVFSMFVGALTAIAA